MQNERIDSYRLSPQQNHLWLLQQGGRDTTYRAQCAVLVEGALDVEMLKAAIRRVVERHEILRTTFRQPPALPLPVQVIADTGALVFQQLPLNGLEVQGRQARIAALLHEQGRLPFDLERGPLLHISLAALSPDEHLLLLGLPALCADLATLDNLMREISRSYAACVDGEDLPGEPMQYADLAEVLNELLESEDMESGRAYWRAQALSAVPPLKLPTERYRSGTSGFAPHVLDLALDHGLAAQIAALAGRYEASVPVFLLACWHVLLWRLSGQPEVVVGVAYDGRTYPGLDEALGLFAKYLPLRCHFEEHLRFSNILKRLDRSYREAYEWQEYFSWEMAAGASEICFDFIEMPAKHSAVGLSFVIEQQHAYFDRFKLKLTCIQKADALITEFHYDAGLFSAEDIGRLAGAFQRLLESVIDHPEAALDEFDILSPAERTQLLVEFNRTQADYPRDTCVHRLFEQQAARTPDAVAIVFDRGQGAAAQAPLPPPARGGTDLLPPARGRTDLPPPAGGGTEGGNGTETGRASPSTPLPPPARGRTEGGNGTETGRASPSTPLPPPARGRTDLPPPARGRTEGGNGTETGRASPSAPPPAGGGTEGGRGWASKVLNPQSSVLSPQSLTYAELDRRANQLAHYLQKLGVGPETCVAICMERSPELVVGLLGVLKAGGAYLPLDPTYPQARLAFVLEDSHVAVLITANHTETGRHGDKETGVRGQGSGVRGQGSDVGEHQTQNSKLKTQNSPSPPHLVTLSRSWPTIAAEPPSAPACRTTPDNLAYVIYTSGSTGSPKGVMVPHRGLVNYLSWCVKAYRVAEGRGAPVHSPIGFDLTITSLFAPLLAGQRVVLLPEERGLEALNAPAHVDFSLVKITPSHLALLNQQLPASSAAAYARALIIGGEALGGEALAFWRTHAPATRLINEYGPTEATVGCCVYEVAADAPPSGAVPIGRPIANTRLYLLDRHLSPAPIGVAGELYIGGDGLARGYLGRPDLTAERFVPNPFARVLGDGCWVLEDSAPNTQHPTPNTRLYKTGDLARYRPDGVIEFLGRIDGQVKVRGFRIELGEIEAVLSQHPAVREAVAVAREDVAGDVRLVAYVVTSDKLQVTSREEASLVTRHLLLVTEVRAFLQERLPDYMVPSVFEVLDALPLSPNGKLDRKALPVPQQLRPGPEHTYVAPRTAVEEVLAGIWAEILHVEKVGIHDNFFRLGGYSLLATQVSSRVADAFEVELSLFRIFEAPTVAELAAALLENPDERASVEKTAELLLSLSQLSEEEIEALVVEKRSYDQIR